MEGGLFWQVENILLPETIFVGGFIFESYIRFLHFKGLLCRESIMASRLWRLGGLIDNFKSKSVCRIE